ncbi:hypothetical protein P9112_000571 [Eukaryota sp. TZLM1-RC]
MYQHRKSSLAESFPPSFEIDAEENHDSLLSDDIDSDESISTANAAMTHHDKYLSDLKAVDERDETESTPGIGPYTSYRRIVILPEDQPLTPEVQEACSLIHSLLRTRERYVYSAPSFPHTYRTDKPPDMVFSLMRNLPEAVDVSFSSTKGIFSASITSEAYTSPPLLEEYFSDLHALMRLVGYGPLKTLAYRRLQFLETKFHLYRLLNDADEKAAQKEVPYRDLYNVRKVDNHIHASAAMSHRFLLQFMKEKIVHEPDEIVAVHNGKKLTLTEVFDELNISPTELSVDVLDVQADQHLFHRFDRFNQKYNPCGQTMLREIFLKTNNHINGRYFAEILKKYIFSLEDQKYQSAELRLSIYGKDPMEWDLLARWFLEYEMQYNRTVRWLIQIPRLYSVYKEGGFIETFSDMLSNIFQPLFEVTQNPSTHPHLHYFLQSVVGFDSVDDESKPERKFFRKLPHPDDWDSAVDPPFSYYIYYIYANIHTLNSFRHSRGMNVFAFRPHAGEAGDIEHCAAAYMCANSINHGIQLRKTPVLQYLFYLTQIGMSVSPLSNNSLFLDYHRNPFPNFFKTGLNVTLSTDDPLQFHFTQEPLTEEYSIAAQVWKLSSADLCEIAWRSVLISGFDHETKSEWLGPNYSKQHDDEDSIRFTNVPRIRSAFRSDLLKNEQEFIEKGRRFGIDGKDDTPLAPTSRV